MPCLLPEECKGQRGAEKNRLQATRNQVLMPCVQGCPLCDTLFPGFSFKEKFFCRHCTIIMDFFALFNFFCFVYLNIVVFFSLKMKFQNSFCNVSKFFFSSILLRYCHKCCGFYFFNHGICNITQNVSNNGSFGID